MTNPQIARHDLKKGEKIIGFYLKLEQNYSLGNNDVWFSFPHTVTADSELIVTLIRKPRRRKICET